MFEANCFSSHSNNVGMTVRYAGVELIRNRRRLNFETVGKKQHQFFVSKIEVCHLTESVKKYLQTCKVFGKQRALKPLLCLLYQLYHPTYATFNSPNLRRKTNLRIRSSYCGGKSSTTDTNIFLANLFNGKSQATRCFTE